jgi:hypothetical protein
VEILLHNEIQHFEKYVFSKISNNGKSKYGRMTFIYMLIHAMVGGITAAEHLKILGNLAPPSEPLKYDLYASKGTTGHFGMAPYFVCAFLVDASFGADSWAD